MTRGLVRILSCLLLFGLSAQALGGGTVGVIGSAIVAPGANHLWHEQQRADATRVHREAVEADEDLRLAVRERRSKAEAP
jgi:hypothetical protein